MTILRVAPLKALQSCFLILPIVYKIGFVSFAIRAVMNGYKRKKRDPSADFKLDVQISLFKDLRIFTVF